MLAYGTHLFRGVELNTLDARYSVRGDQAPPSDIVLVGIDNKTFSELQLRFPFPRSHHATVIDRLVRDGAKQIAIDIQFSERSAPGEDRALLGALGRARGTVLATTDVRNGRPVVFADDAALREAGIRVGDASYVPEPGGTLRRISYAPQGLKSFAVAVAEAAAGSAIDESDLGGPSAWIDYRGPPGTFPAASYSDVSSGDVRAGTFKDKIVIVGATESTLQDVHPTPTTGDQLMAGPEIQANAVATALDGFRLQSTPLGIDVLLIALLAMVAPLANLVPAGAGPRSALAPLRALGICVLAAAIYLFVAQIAFNSGRILPVVYPLLALGIAAVGGLAVNYVMTAFERQRVRDTFARFVPEGVVDRVLERTDDDLRLGATLEEVTVLFSDIRGFTTFSESRDVVTVIEVLNRYLSEMSDAIMDNGGTLVSYIGDGIMAVFGAPIKQGDHADRALAAAREMLEERLPRFNEWMEKHHGEGADPADPFRAGFRMGVGLNSGPVMSGQVGSERRLDYTAIGDTVNTASRLEGLTKGTPHQLFISESTHAKLGDEAAELVYVDEMPIRGREQGIKVWTLPGDEAAPTGS